LVVVVDGDEALYSKFMSLEDAKNDYSDIIVHN
jgi:hypothetical protein